VPASRDAAWSFSLSPSQRQHPGLVYSTSLRLEASPAAAAAHRARKLGWRTHGTRREAARGSADSAAATIDSSRLLRARRRVVGFCRRGRSVGRGSGGRGQVEEVGIVWGRGPRALRLGFAVICGLH
jgi:hypothetical protein